MSSRPLLSPPGAPVTPLARHRKLSPLAGVTVSPLCLGAMSIGDQWAEYGMGAMDKDSSFKLLDAFYEAGGNFIDTSNNYQNQSSERFIGEWMEGRGIRDQLVVATKYTTNPKMAQGNLTQVSVFSGNHLKSLRHSLEESLKNLRTTYVDILYVHWWDWNSGVEEVMNGLHNLVVAGKVLYLGISDTPAWIVAQANTYARCMGKTPFVIYEGAWSVLQRDVEREILPMARSLGLAIAPWNVLAGGKIRTDAEEEERRKTGEKGRAFASLSPGWERNETERQVAKVLEGVAAEVGTKSIQAVAIAYVMQKTPYVFPLIGGRKVEHLYANIEALKIALTPEQIKTIEGAVPFEHGFPHKLLEHTVLGDGTSHAPWLNMFGHFDAWPAQQAIRPQ